MPSPWSLISSYPPDDADMMTHLKDKKMVHVYVDVKNVMTALFIKEVENEIVLNTKNLKSVDSTIFQSCVCYAAFWRKYFYKKNLRCKIFFCTDVGRSRYHLDIHSGYKKRREISEFNTAGLLGDEIKKIRDKNFYVCEKILNRLSGVYFFKLDYLESDFLPHYLIKHKFDDPSILHVVCSGDKDLMQTLVYDNVIMIYKLAGQRNFIDKHNFLFKFFKIKDASDKSKKKSLDKLLNFDPKNYTLLMSLIGDAGDDIPGVDGIGSKRALDILSEQKLFEKMIENSDSVRERILNKGKFFREDVVGVNSLNNMWKKVFLKNDVVTDAFKMIDFEMLISWLTKEDTLAKIDWIKYINKILNKDDIHMINSANVFLEGTKNIPDFQLTYRDILVLFEQEYLNFMENRNFG